jgi:glutamate N-acetyltransferase/amino-acid N-acetyltransferase
MSVLQFDFDASVITNNHRRNSHHRRLLQALPSRSTTASIPPLASISAHGTLSETESSGVPSSISAKIPESSPIEKTAFASEAPAGTILPVGLKRGPHPRRYLWDGHRLVAVELSDLESVSSAASALDTIENNRRHNGANSGRGIHRRRKRVFVPLPRLDHAIARWLHGARSAFFPHPQEVTPDYWEWCKWRATHRIFSSMASVFGTQSLLLAIGVGAKRTLPAAAAINWVLKDGLGRLGRLSVATKFGESFDSDLKRFRFSSSLLYATSLSLDFLTPLFPHYFLPMASLANVGKSVGLTTYISTQPAFHRSFAISENLADISAKSQAQQMAVDTLGLAVAVTLSALCARHSESARRLLPLVAFPFLVGGDLMAISNELRSIHLRSLNKERAEILAAEFVATGHVATPENVSAKERLILPPACSLGVLPLYFGGLETVLTTGKEVELFLNNLHLEKDGGTASAAASEELNRKRRRKSRGRGIVSLLFGSNSGSSRSSSNAILEASKKKYAVHVVLPSLPATQSLHINNENDKKRNIYGFAPYFFDIVSDINKWVGFGKTSRGAVHAALRTDATPEVVLEIILRTAKLRQNITKKIIEEEEEEEEKTFEKFDVPEKEFKHFVKGLREAGWQVAPFMLSSAEKKFYCEMN